jgi:DNA-binding NtrC family response regulator
MREYNLLLVDDDPFILEGIGENLEAEGYQVTRADTGDKAVRLFEKCTFDLVITDLVMEQTDGIQVLKKAKEINPDIMVIILTGYGDMISAIAALRNHADDYLLKPCEPQEMFYRVARCLEQAEMSRKLNLYQKLLPMCCVCKKVRDGRNGELGREKWISVEKFIHEKAKLDITSSYCPECAQKTMAEFSQHKSKSSQI